VSAASNRISNLKNDLRQILSQTYFLIKQNKMKLFFNLAKLIVDNKMADQAEIEKY